MPVVAADAARAAELRALARARLLGVADVLDGAGYHAAEALAGRVPAGSRPT